MARVLVVDDDERIAASVRRALVYDGYTVHLAADGKSALAMLRDDPPDLVILDVMLPGVDGAAINTAGPDAFAAQPPLAPLDLSDSNDTFVELLDGRATVLSTNATLNGAPVHVPAEVLQQATSLTTVELAPGLLVRMNIRHWTRPDLRLDGYVVVGQTVRGPQATQAGIRGFLWRGVRRRAPAREVLAQPQSPAKAHAERLGWKRPRRGW